MLVPRAEYLGVHYIEIAVKTENELSDRRLQMMQRRELKNKSWKTDPFTTAIILTKLSDLIEVTRIRERRVQIPPLLLTSWVTSGKTA